MLNIFKEDYFWMLKESKVYFPWIESNSEKYVRYLFKYFRPYLHPFYLEFHPLNAREIITRILDRIESQNELIDLLFKALIRSEIRFVSRYIPQKSNEERLTGNLVSEMDSAVFLIRENFYESSLKLYSEKKEIDFFYMDMSKGGKVEKKTGADLAFLVIVDLPDYPYTIKSIVLQAKKIHGSSSQLDRKQFETLDKNAKENGGYLFYDMNFKSLLAPMVLEINQYPIRQKYDESKKGNTSSFSVNGNEILQGFPLSFFIFHRVINENFGKSHSSIEDAVSFFSALCRLDKETEETIFNGRLGIISIGKKINFQIVDNEVLSVTL